MRSKTIRIYDPETGRLSSVEGLILKLGLRAVARKYKVSELAVRKWRNGTRRPSPHTLERAMKQLF